MKPRHLFIALLLLLAGAAIVPARAVAQTPPPVPGAPPPDTPPAPILVEPRDNDFPFDDAQDRVRFGQDFTLREGDSANDVVVVMGNATLEGTHTVTSSSSSARCASGAVRSSTATSLP
jgi:hypothetical protein